MKKYYFLNGIQKNGPFSEEELIRLNLDIETLVWTEGFDNWIQLKDIKELIKTIPPPIPENIPKKIVAKKQSKKLLLSTFLLLALLIISFIVIYTLIESKKAELKQELTHRVENIFNDKPIICDGVKFNVTGDLKEITKPIKTNSESFDLVYGIELDEYEKAKEEGLIEKFYCKNGGFTIKKISKIDTGYELEITTSTNMAFTSSNYWRGTVQEAYNSTFNYFIERDADFYEKGSYQLIENFPNLMNEYYELKNAGKPSNLNFSHSMLADGANIQNNYRKVYYKQETWYYEISPKKAEIEIAYIRYLSVTGGFSFFIFILSLILNPFKW